MKMIIGFVVMFMMVLATGATEYPKTVEEAKKIIQDYVKSYGQVGVGGLCDKNTCCTVSSSEKCPISNMKKDASTLVLPGGSTRCIFSDSTPFAFQVIPGDKDKVVVFFQGGGACWDESSTTTSMCSTDVSPQSLVGLFDRADTKNQFRTYTIVHVSYCSGDLFGGNVTRSYNDKQGKPVVQVGLHNAQSAVDWIKAQMQNGGLSSKLANLVVSGCSAGSIGAQLWGSQVLKQLSWTHAAVVPDSYAGVFPDGSVGPLIYDFGFCSSGFLSSSLYTKCMNKQLELTDINMEFIGSLPKVPYNFIQSKTDIVQQSFYTAVAASMKIQPTVITPSDFYTRVNKIFGTYNKGNSNFLTYLVDGDQHCFTPAGLYYEADTKGAHDQGKTTSTQMMYSWVNQYPLAEGAASNTRCDVGTAANTYCDASVAPKSFTEHW